MKIANVEFPETLLKALRDGTLVVFAGAGVSMGKPANLPDFDGLANAIGQRAGQAKSSETPADRFLGQLQDREVRVHYISAEILGGDDKEPTELHTDLLRLYGDESSIRIVTTNFDQLFEKAADELFAKVPECFRGPALPLGERFQGIVHLHGSVVEPEEMILTDKDFGRAYLTENDGWARRFLVELFANFTVLFVGYSHSDTIMTYMSRALPAGGAQARYAMSRSLALDDQRWTNLGIQPIIFNQDSEGDFQSLDKAIKTLADYLRRGILDWQQEIQRIALNRPTILLDEELDVILDALNDEAKTRFFTEVATSPDWVDWLDRKNQLEALFNDATLSEREISLSFWLARQFACKHSDTLFNLIGRHNTALHPYFFRHLAWEIGQQEDHDPSILAKWVSLLLKVAPEADSNLDVILQKLGERCTASGLINQLPQIFEVLATSGLRSSRPIGSNWRHSDISHWDLNEYWERILKPRLKELAEPLLRLVTSILERLHSESCVWRGENRNASSLSWSRSAIEPHEQDRHPEPVDVLIDIARNSLESLAQERPNWAQVWAEQHIDDEAPLLRRLAIHAISATTSLTADAKIAWLLEHTDIHDISIHHEIFQAAKMAYPYAGQEEKRAFMGAISAYTWPEEVIGEGELHSERHKYDWFHWLHSADPTCEIAKEALDKTVQAYPEFRPNEHPDLIYWMSTVEVPHSPWTAKELLAKPAVEWLPELLAYNSTEFGDYSREQMLREIQDATQQNPGWGIELANALGENGQWESDIWPRLIRAWGSAELDETCLQRALDYTSSADLHRRHTREVTYSLSELARNETNLEIAEIRAQANALALTLWDFISDNDSSPPASDADWLTAAINHESGQLSRYWISSMSAWRKSLGSTPNQLDDEYLKLLTKIMGNMTMPGKLARCALVNQFSFMLAIDPEWTQDNLLPLLEVGNPDFQSAWDGLLYSGVRGPAAAELLKGIFLAATERLNCELADRQGHFNRQGQFIKCYSLMLCWFSDEQNKEWINNLFKHGDRKVKESFANEIRFFLTDLEEAHQQEWWNRWLKDYWQYRLQNIPTKLEDNEIERMFKWALCLNAVFPEAVELATKMPTIPLRDHLLLYDLAENPSLESHPADMAKFLIHLGKCESKLGVWHGVKLVVERLLELDMPDILKTGLRELIVQKNLQ